MHIYMYGILHPHTICTSSLLRLSEITVHSIIDSLDNRMEGTSKILWLKLAWQKHCLDKMAQHPLQFRTIQC